jgi:hypothetical protein
MQHKTITIFWRVLKSFMIITVFLSGFLALAYNVYQIPMIKNKHPWLDNNIQAFMYEQKAKKFPPSDYAAKRYRAMAEAARQGSHDYTYTSGTMPVGAK